MHRDKFRLYIFYIGIILTIFGLPFSRALLSFGQVTLAALFLFDKNLLKKLKVFINDKAALALISLYVLSWLALLYTNDYQYGFFDLRTKIPLILFPLVFATEPRLSKRAFQYLALLFAATVTASISCSLILLMSDTVNGFRDAFPFVSHIRLSLQVLIAMSIFFYYGINKKYKYPLAIKIILLTALVYLFWAMFTLELMTGIVISLISLSLALIRLVIRKRSALMAWMTFASGLLIITAIAFGFYSTVKSYTKVNKIDLSSLDKQTALGNDYTHNPDEYQVENGSYIGLYIQWDEMREAWNKRSTLNYDGNDNRQQLLRYTLQRYLNSKHLRKDANGIEQLTQKDLQNIENGIANVEYAKKFSFKKRIYKLIWEYDMYQRGEDAFGHTLIQRFELWSTGWEIFTENPLIGVGTGDIPSAFKTHLEQNNSTLKDSNLRTHNQYLSILASLGIIGIIVFLFSMFYPPSFRHIWNSSLFFYFFSFISISMFWEDTIETQVGVTLFSFFFAFYLYGQSKDKQ